MFGLTAQDHEHRNCYLKRHRLFESPLDLAPRTCRCTEYEHAGWLVAGVYGGGSADNNHAKTIRRGGYTPAKDVGVRLMGIDWMGRRALAQAIPPTYTHWLGQQALGQLERQTG